MRPTLPLILVAAIMVPSISAADTKAASLRARSGTFDAYGTVACAQEVGEARGTCNAAVARFADAAVAKVTFANGFSRLLIFSDRKFMRGNSTMSGVGTDVEWQLSEEIYYVRVDDQRFELPEGLIFGE
ncbi:hypothetical protein CLV77_2213 [Brevirhabdus pacifica]|nr:hypothetical protein CLV77_2213 [Brevirhabdus pacifica]